ncbi:MAG: glycosyl hydrolase, partial [Gammaproteobacteria bacterium]|nr:glycosyl hydrolase [Gammaproteobacteria bacterium]
MEPAALNWEAGNAICYSGYREGQSPLDGRFPTYAQILEDLKILQAHWKYLRLYDCSQHAEVVLEVIRNEDLDFRVMLGANMAAELSNPNCPWGAHFSDETLRSNKLANRLEIGRMIGLANRYAECVFSVSVGNEATVEWTDHMVPVESLIDYVRRIKNGIDQPVTFCENYVPWTHKLEPLAEELDFIS